MDKTIELLRVISENGKLTQRALSKKTGLALGSVNSSLKQMETEKLIRKAEEGIELTQQGRQVLKPCRTQKAVIMAAGFGSRFVPLTLEKPKGLLEVFGEPMVERQIRQLQEAGVTDITIIVGYMKEAFEYLIDKFGVKLLYNPEFTDKNTLASLYHAKDVLKGSNAYVLSSDNWMRENLYHRYEPHAWYAAAHADGPTSEWVLEADSRGRITDTYPGGCDCDYMYGPAYFSAAFSETFLPVLDAYYHMSGTENFYWEHVLMELLNGRARKRLLAAGRSDIADTKPEMYINRQQPDIIYEFENLEELRRFDPKYENDSGSGAMQLVSEVLKVPESRIRKIRCLKAGMTNNSWLFEVDGSSYICRIPGEGTEKLINRRQEADVYKAVRKLDITEELVYLDPKTGYKISRFYENSRNADPKNIEEMKQCMQLLHRLHSSDAGVKHEFDIAERICAYEGLILEQSGYEELGKRMRSGKIDPEDEKVLDAVCEAVPFQDYRDVRSRRFALLKKLGQQEKGREKKLCHIDSVADNFIFVPAEGGQEELKLIDWEYAGMADPIIDLAMCGIYSFMEENEILQLAELYYEKPLTPQQKQQLYAYVALGGLLWSLWGIYKQKLGVQFTDYTLKMYRYFKEYSNK